MSIFIYMQILPYSHVGYCADQQLYTDYESKRLIKKQSVIYLVLTSRYTEQAITQVRCPINQLVIYLVLLCFLTKVFLLSFDLLEF